MFNSIGQSVYNKEQTISNNLTTEISEIMDAGIYSLIIKSADKILVKKIVVE